MSRSRKSGRIRRRRAPQGRAAGAAGKLGRAGKLVFPEQFFPAAKAGRDRARFSEGGAARSIWWTCIVASAFSGLRPPMSSSRLSAWNMTDWRSRQRERMQKRERFPTVSSFPRRSRSFAGAAAEIFLGKNFSDSRPAAQRLLAGNIEVIARNEAGAGHLRFLPSGDDGAGFEHFVRGRVFELARVQPLDMFPQTQHIECVAICGRDKILPNRAQMDSN